MKWKIAIISSIVLNIVLVLFLFLWHEPDLPEHLLTIPNGFTFEKVNLEEKEDSYMLSYTLSYEGAIPEKAVEIYYPDYVIDVILVINEYEISIPLNNTVELKQLLYGNNFINDFQISKRVLGEKEKELLSMAAAEQGTIVNFAQFKVRRKDSDQSFFTYVAYKEKSE